MNDEFMPHIDSLCKKVIEQHDRIKVLEAALTLRDEYTKGYCDGWKDREALAQSSPPKTQPPPFNPDDWGDPSSPPKAST